MSASDSTHVAHVVARRLAVERGAATVDVVAYSSSQAHSSIEKGARVAGIRHVRLIDVDADLALRPDALAAAGRRHAPAPPGPHPPSSRARSAPRPPARSIRSARSRRSRAATGSGTTWTPRGPARP